MALNPEIRVSCLLALLLSGGSLLVYAIAAAISRLAMGSEGKTSRSFNLGLPTGQVPEGLFGISIAAASTTFSTAVVIFLLNAGSVGIHLFFCPVAFTLGMFFLLKVYKQAEKQGYMDDSEFSGLVPYMIYKMSRGKVLSIFIGVLSLFPLLGILALELRYGTTLLQYLIHGAFQPDASPSESTGYTFIAFLVLMTLLLSYVFVGGFRAVVASDVWQYKTMQVGFTLVMIAFLLLAYNRRGALNWSVFGSHRMADLVRFYIDIAVINFFTPMALATTWQRFRAFRARSTNFDRAIKGTIVKAGSLWATLIAIGILIRLVGRTEDISLLAGSTGGSTGSKLGVFYGLLHVVSAQNDWFALFVFPLLTVAAFSGMYSSSDTCVSSLLYLTETSRSIRVGTSVVGTLGKRYYFAMGLIFVLAIVTFAGAIVSTEKIDLLTLAEGVFGLAVTLGPTVLLLAWCPPAEIAGTLRRRRLTITTSLVLGLTLYAFFMIFHSNGKAVLRPWAAVAGLIAALIPALILVLSERSGMRKDASDVRDIGTGHDSVREASAR